jgi:hypothetical protein
MENLGDDAVMMGGIEQNTEIPAGMEFVVSGAPDGEFAFQCSANGPGMYNNKKWIVSLRVVGRRM